MNRPAPTPASRSRAPARKGFTLTELMIATAIGGLLLTMALALFLGASRGSWTIYDSLVAGRDVRMFTARFAQASRESAKFYLYESYEARAAKDLRKNGDSGDFAVFLVRKRRLDDTPDWSDKGVVYSLSCFYRVPVRDIDGKVRGPVYSFEVPVKDIKAPLASLPDPNVIKAGSATHNKIIELAEGKNLDAAFTADKVITEEELRQSQLFLNFNDRSIIIRAEMRQQSRAGKTLINTYNYTATPRG